MVELGISTFGETTILETTGETLSHAKRIRHLVEEIELADKVGLDVYSIGEHHREDFAVSAPEIILAAGAARTQNVKLSPAVTVLSSQDPVRVYQQYATIDAISSGRAEIMVGRGSFTESFPLFGYDLNDYEALFDEKLAMLKEIDKQPALHWHGKHTQTVHHASVFPRPESGHLPIWVATGGNVESTIKIAQQGLPIAYAIIGGNPLGFKRLIEAYREIGEKSGQDMSKMKVGAHSWGYIADDTQEAIDQYFHPTKQTVDNIAKTRPFWQPMTRPQYDAMVGEDGAMFVGNPEVVANKMIKVIESLGLDRFLLHLPVGSMPHDNIMHAIKLFGEEVAPKVRDYFAKKEMK